MYKYKLLFGNAIGKSGKSNFGCEEKLEFFESKTHVSKRLEKPMITFKLPVFFLTKRPQLNLSGERTNEPKI
jgi:hypothetical protein